MTKRWVVAIVIATGTALGAQAPAGLFGFRPASADAERTLETRFLTLPSADRAREYHRFLTEQPHLAGSDRNRQLAEWMRDRWKEYGLDQVEIVEHDVLLPWPVEMTLEMTEPRPWKARFTEDPIPGDPDTATPVIHYNAYSTSGEITAPVVYAASGNPENYDWLEAHGIDVRGKIVLVRYSYPYSYRGFKALTAQKRGVAGLLIYSDPAEDGAKKGAVYPDGPWGNDSHIQSGGIPYDFMVPGDPLTPGWASVPGAKRISRDQAVSLPNIMSAPLSARDARTILETMGGPEAPKEWQGGLPLSYHVGPGATLRMKVVLDDKIRPIQTVIGRIRGTSVPDDEVILGNHRDAWIYGGVDPSSGTASMMDLARSLGALVRAGVRPKRTIVFASWDAEEFTLTSSTEWGEQNEADLRDHAIAYLNVDSSTSGPTFTASAVPSLNQLIAEVAASIPDPKTGLTVAQAKQKDDNRQTSGLPNAAGSALVSNRLGSGSDYTVFLNFIGVPIVDMAFDGAYGVYHSQYDDHLWVSRIGDPGFKYHEAMTKLWGVMALRLANADALPLDYRPYASAVADFERELEAAWTKKTPPPDAGAVFEPLRAAVNRFAQASNAAAAAQSAALASGEPSQLEAINRRLMRAERGLLDPEGIPGRPWYRHQIYAPKFTYAPDLLPALGEAIEAGDSAGVSAAVSKISAALDRASKALTE